MSTPDCESGMTSPSKDRPIFIVGMQRSGTTLMRAILTAHSNIAISPETHFLNYFMSALSSKNGSAFDDFWTIFSGSERFQDLGVPAEKIRQSIIESGDYGEKSIFSMVLRQYAADKGKERWGEKTPHHYRHIDTLLAWYSEARIVYLLRDPRAVCSSLLTVPWRKWNLKGLRSLESDTLRRLRRVLHDAECWQSQVDELRTRWLGESRITVVKYEDLVSSPEAVTKRICAFVEEPFSETMITGRRWRHLSDRSPVESARRSSWEADHLTRSLRPISTDSVDKWKARLSEMETIAIEDTCTRGMEWAGYRSFGAGSGLRLQGKLAAARMWSAVVDRVKPDKSFSKGFSE